MRLDLFLKSTGVIARRPVAKRACDEGLIEINGKPAKAAAEVHSGDVITVRIGMKVTTHEVLGIPVRPPQKHEREDYVRLLSTEKVDLDI